MGAGEDVAELSKKLEEEIAGYGEANSHATCILFDVPKN
jgi:hypothetical protein